MIDFNFVYRRYPAKLLIPVVDVPTSPERKCNIHVYDTALQPINPRNKFGSRAWWLSVLLLTSSEHQLLRNHRGDSNPAPPACQASTVPLGHGSPYKAGLKMLYRFTKSLFAGVHSCLLAFLYQTKFLHDLWTASHANCLLDSQLLHKQNCCHLT